MMLHIGIAGPLATQDLAHLLTDDPAQLPSEMHGAPLLVSLIEEYLARGHRVSAFTVDPALEPREGNIVVGRGPRFDLYYVPIRRRSFRPSDGAAGRMTDFYRLERQNLMQAMHMAQPDIVHAHWQYEYAWAALDSGLPNLVTCHDAPWQVLKFMPNLYRFGRLLMARHVLRRARHVTAVSPYLKNRLRPMTKAAIKVVPNPLRREGGRTVGPIRHAGQTPRVIMILNGWGKHKNPIPGLEALLRLYELYPQIELHVVGPDFGQDERGAVWAREQGAAGVIKFHGRLPYADVQALLSTMDLLIHPALEESFGMTVAEAMSMGIPVVAGDRCGGVPWVSGEGSAGRLVDVTSAAAVAEAAASLLFNADEYARCSEAGRRRATETFSCLAVGNAFLELYDAAIAAHGRPLL